MIDTTDLPSYYPGYDEYCESRDKAKEYDDSDEYYDEFMIRGGYEIMHRKIIDLKITQLTIDEIYNLNNYVWKQDKLIPGELLEGE